MSTADKAKSLYASIKRLEESLKCETEEKINYDDQNVIRRHLGDLHRSLATEISYSLGQKYGLEERSWKFVCYAAVEQYRSLSCKSYEGDAFLAEGNDNLKDSLGRHLDWSIPFWVDWLSALVRKHESLFAAVQKYTLSTRMKDLSLSYNRIFTYLGDLRRYQGIYNCHKDSESPMSIWNECIQMYSKAVSFAPTNGKCWYQLGLVHKLAGRPLKAFYCYIRSLAVPSPYLASRESMMILLELNRRQYVTEKKRVDTSEQMLFFLGCLYGKIGLGDKLIRIISKSLPIYSMQESEPGILLFTEPGNYWELAVCILHCSTLASLGEQFATAAYLLHWILGQIQLGVPESEACLILKCILNWHSESSSSILSMIACSNDYLVSSLGPCKSSWYLSFFETLQDCILGLIPESEPDDGSLASEDLYILCQGISWIPHDESNSISTMFHLLKDITAPLPAFTNDFCSQTLKKDLMSTWKSLPFVKDCHLDRKYLEMKLVQEMESAKTVEMVKNGLEISSSASNSISDSEDSEDLTGSEDEVEFNMQSIPDDMKILLERKDNLERKLETHSRKNNVLKSFLPNTIIILDTNEWMSHAQIVLERIFSIVSAGYKIGVISVVISELKGLWINNEAKRESAKIALTCLSQLVVDGAVLLFDAFGKSMEQIPSFLSKTNFETGKSTFLEDQGEDWQSIFRKLGKTSGATSLDDILLHACSVLNEHWKNKDGKATKANHVSPIVLVTSDRNLRVKASVDGIPCCTWSKFRNIVSL